jgi:hypothetical protein
MCQFICRYFHGECEKCSQKFSSRQRLKKHVIECVLEESADLNFLWFPNRGDCESWIDEMQRKTKTFFSKHYGDKNVKGTTYSYLYCQHNQQTRAPTSRKTSRKRKCGPTPDYCCSARISIRENEDGVSVCFNSNHNHECGEENLKYQPFPRSLREEVRSLLVVGMDTKKICELYKSDKWLRENSTMDTEVDKVDHLSRR